MKRIFFVWMLCLGLNSLPAQFAVANDSVTPPVAGREAAPLAQDPEVEARLVNLAQELRCLVCQNESLASSHAELADDLRQEVRGLIKQGKTDQEIKAFLVARYGDFVLYRPEVKPMTWVLWFGPFALLMLAFFFLVRYIGQRRRAQAQPVALNPESLAQAQQLLNKE